MRCSRCWRHLIKLMVLRAACKWVRRTWSLNPAQLARVDQAIAGLDEIIAGYQRMPHPAKRSGASDARRPGSDS